MDALIVIFIVSGLILFYTYIGYGVIIKLLNSRKGKEKGTSSINYYPEVTHIVTAYNEQDCIEEKMRNCLMLDYPVNRIETIIISDGSNDQTKDLVESNPRFIGMHEDERRGKLAAMERAVARANSDLIVFSDANAMLNPAAIHKMIGHFQNPEVGAVAGEKRVISSADQNAAKGEGLYWRYESFLKKQDSDYHTVVGAAGELFAVRRDLFETPEKACIIEDFVLTVDIAAKGYKVAYEPEAIASENGSASLFEELKRKVRISAGGLQASWRLKGYLNPLKYGKLAFQLFSHRVARWTIAPLSLVIAFISSLMLALSGSNLFVAITLLQVMIYAYAFIGFQLEKRKKPIKFGMTIFYFMFMNLSVFFGLLFLVRGKQMVIWDKVRRA